MLGKVVKSTSSLPSADYEPIQGYKPQNANALGFDLPMQQVPATVISVERGRLSPAMAAVTWTKLKG